MTAALLGLGLPLAAGAAVVAALGPGGRRAPVLETAAISFLTGQFLLALAFLAAARLTPGLVPSATAVLLGATLSAALGLRTMRRRRSPAPAAAPAAAEGLRPRSALAWIAAAGCASFLACAVLHAWLTPIERHDGWAVYAFKARAYFVEGGIPEGPLGRSINVADYPPLLPAGAAWLSLLHGAWSERWLKLVAPLCLAAAAVLLAGTIGRRSGPALGWGMAALMAGTPQVFGHGRDAVADVPLLAYALASFVVWEEAMRRRSPGGLALAGLLAGGGAWVKNEGAVLVVLLLGLHGLRLAYEGGPARSRPGPSRSRLLLAPAAAALVALAPWWIQKAVWGIANVNVSARTLAGPDSLARLARLPGVYRQMAMEMLYSIEAPAAPGSVWLLGWVAFWIALGLWAAGRRPSGSAWIALAVLGGLAIYNLVFALSPFDMYYQMSTAYARVLLHFYGLALLFAGLVFGRVLGPREVAQ